MSTDPRVTDHVGIAPERLLALSAEVGQLNTLDQVVRWGLSQHPPRLVSDVVTQDEYTLDVCLRIGDQLVLVFDTT